MAKADPGSLQFKFMVNGTVSAGQVNLTADLIPLITAIAAARITPSQFSAVITPAAPVNTVPPAITGSAVVGATATVSTGTWTGAPNSFTVQWYKDNVAISGATGFAYVYVSGDATHTITAKVKAYNAVAPSGVSATSNTVTPAAAPSGVTIANTAALTAMFAAGVGASGGKTYLLAGVSFGAFSVSSVDFSSNPIIIVGQSGTVFTSLTHSAVKGVTWDNFNVNGAAVGTGVTIGNGSSHITFNLVTANPSASNGNGFAIDASSTITINGTSDAAVPDITNRGTAVVITDSSGVTLNGLTITSVGPDGILLAGVNGAVINACLGYDWTYSPGDHPDFIQGFRSSRTGNGNNNITVTNCGWLREAGLPAQCYFFEYTSNLVVDTSYGFGCLGNFVQQSGGTTALLNNNFGQGFGDFAPVLIARDAAINVTMTNNKAEGFVNYAGGGVNSGFVPATLPGSNTQISATTAENYTALDAWLTANPAARARP